MTELVTQFMIELVTELVTKFVTEFVTELVADQIVLRDFSDGISVTDTRSYGHIYSTIGSFPTYFKSASASHKI